MNESSRSDSQSLELKIEEPPSSPLTLCIKYLFLGFGVISYATLILPFAKFVDILYSLAKCSDFKCCCGCLICCLEWLNMEMKRKTYNDYTIIISALTGASYQESSKMLIHCSNRTYTEEDSNKIDK